MHCAHYPKTVRQDQEVFPASYLLAHLWNYSLCKEAKSIPDGTLAVLPAECLDLGLLIALLEGGPSLGAVVLLKGRTALV